MTTPCVQDEGLKSRIPDTYIPMTYFVEAYHRLDGELEVLRTGFHLEPWQLHTAMAFYCANKELFDAENERFLESKRQFWEKVAANTDARKAWDEIKGALRGDETDEEVDILLERMS